MNHKLGTIFPIVFLSICSAQYFTSPVYYPGLQVGQPYQWVYPQFVSSYAEQQSSRYVFSAPGENQVQADCEWQLDSLEQFFVNTNGSEDISKANWYTGSLTKTFVSVGNSLTLAYIMRPQTRGRLKCAMSTTCNCGWNANRRIVNGIQTQPGEYPSMVGLLNANKNVICGGVIISASWCATAIHCTRTIPQSEMRIVAGLYATTDQNNPNTQTREVVRIVENPNYDKVSDSADLAMLELKSPFGWSIVIAPACLPLFYNQNAFSNATVYATGWGSSEFGGPRPSNLQAAQLQVIDNAQCAASYKPYNMTVSATQLCTYKPKVDTCQFDSGGPVYVKTLQENRHFVVALICSGLGCANGAPGLNTRLSAFFAWIEGLTGPLCRRPMV